MEIQNKLNNDYLKELIKYKKGFYLLIEYFDLLPDEEKKRVNKKLNRLNL